MKNSKTGSVRSKKRCAFCRGWYAPDARTRGHQLSCRIPECRKNRKAQADRNWRIKHPGYGVKWKYKQREWAKGYPDYWRHYRKAHPQYAERERKRMRSRRAKVKIVAKEDAIHRRVDGIVEYLFWREGVAKSNDTDLSASP